MKFLEKLKVLEDSPSHDLEMKNLQAIYDEARKHIQNELDICDAQSYCFKREQAYKPILAMSGGLWSPISRKKNPSK